MNLFNLFKRKKKQEERSAVFGDYLLYNTASSYANNRAMLLSAVYRCVEVISDSIAQLPFEPYKLDSDGCKIKFRNHSTYNLLNVEPNQNMSKFTFMKTMVVSMLLTGNAYAYIQRDQKGNATALYYIPSELVTILKPQNINDTISYSITGMRNVVEDCNMIHILNFTSDGFEGISTLAYARKTLGLAMDAEANAEGFFKGGANVAGILKCNSPLTTKQKESLKSSWNSAFNGNTGTPNGVAVLDADLDFQSVTVNPSDAQLLETRQFNVIDICRFFGVSPVKAFDLSKSSYNTIEQMQLAFLTDTLQPLLEKFECEFQRKLYKPSERDSISVRFSTAPLLRADKQSQASYYNTLFQMGVMTINEIRRELDLPHLEDGDTSFVQVNVQTLKNAATASTTTDSTTTDSTTTEEESTTDSTKEDEESTEDSNTDDSDDITETDKKDLNTKTNEKTL